MASPLAGDHSDYDLSTPCTAIAMDCHHSKNIVAVKFRRWQYVTMAVHCVGRETRNQLTDIVLTFGEGHGNAGDFYIFNTYPFTQHM